jgi:putative acetyltransferase
MQLQAGIFPVHAADFPRAVDVWEASVRATHHFLAEADIQFFTPLVREELPHVAQLACMRNSEGQVAGFIGVEQNKVEMLFVHPSWRGQGIGRQLMTYAITTLGASLVDVNEQNTQALGFYMRMGFEVIARSALDSTGKPFPLLHLRVQGSHVNVSPGFALPSLSTTSSR